MTILSQGSPTLALLVLWDQCQCGERVSHTDKQFIDISRVLENSTQLWYYPEKESDFTGWRLPPPPLTSVASCKLTFAAGRGLRVGCCLILKRIVCGDTHADTARDFIWKGPLGEDQQSKGTWEDCSATWFYGDGVSFGSSLANHADSGSFLVARASLRQDGFQRRRFYIGRMYGLESPLSFWPSLDSSDWSYFASSAFLTRISCF